MHLKGALRFPQGREREEGYIRGMLSALRKLQVGINTRWRADMVFVPEDLWVAVTLRYVPG